MTDSLQVHVRRPCHPCLTSGWVPNPAFTAWEHRWQRDPTIPPTEHDPEVPCSYCDGKGWRYDWLPVEVLLT